MTEEGRDPHLHLTSCVTYCTEEEEEWRMGARSRSACASTAGPGLARSAGLSVCLAERALARAPRGATTTPPLLLLMMLARDGGTPGTSIKAARRAEVAYSYIVCT